MRKLGLRIRFAPQSLVLHKGSHTFGGGGYVVAYANVKGRNLMRLMRRHATAGDWLLFGLVGAPQAALGGVVRQVRRGELKPLVALARGLIARQGRVQNGSPAVLGTVRPPSERTEGVER